MFNKEQYLGLEWRWPTPLNLLAIFSHAVFFVWGILWVVKLLPWPVY